MGKKCRFFLSVLGNISVYALVIYITLSVLMIFRNLTFLDTKQSGVQLVLEIQRVLGVQIKNHSSQSETGGNDTVKNREVSQMK